MTGFSAIIGDKGADNVYKRTDVSSFDHRKFHSKKSYSESFSFCFLYLFFFSINSYSSNRKPNYFLILVAQVVIFKIIGYVWGLLAVVGVIVILVGDDICGNSRG